MQIDFGKDETKERFTAIDTDKVIDEIADVLPLLKAGSDSNFMVVVELTKGDEETAEDICVYAQHVEIPMPSPFVHYVVVVGGEKVASWNEKNNF